MRIRFHYICVIVLFLAGCKLEDSHVEIPKEILSIDSLAQVLVDFSLAESANNLNINNVLPIKIDSIYNFNPLMENKISKARFDSSLNFYAKHGETYKKVYEKVLEQLKELETKRSNEKETVISK